MVETTAKKIVLVSASPRKNGNSEAIVDMVAADLRGADVTAFKMREHNCNMCKACGACQRKETRTCVQKDDITALLPAIENCDAILLASPIYNQQITALGKLFIERLYPFFSAGKKNMSNTGKFGKKAALACVCWGSPRDVTEKYAAWTVSGFSQMGAEQFKSCVFDQIPGPGDVKKREDYVGTIHELAGWLAE